MWNPWAWYRNRHRWEVVIVGLESGVIYPLDFARYSSPERAQGFIDNMRGYGTPMTEFAIVDRHDGR